MSAPTKKPEVTDTITEVPNNRSSAGSARPTSTPNHPSLLSYSSSIHGNAATFHSPHPKNLQVSHSQAGLLMKPSHEAHHSFSTVFMPNKALFGPQSADDISIQQWAHFSVPTPLVIDGKSLGVASVWLRYANGKQGRLRDVKLYDGEVEVATWGPKPLTGHEDIQTEVLHLNFHQRVRHGLCLSVLVIFDGPFRNDGHDWLKIAAAGVDFVMDPGA